MPAFIWDHVWLIWLRFRDVDSSVVRCATLAPPHYRLTKKPTLIRVNPIPHGGGHKVPPLWFFSRGFLADAWNGLIFHDFVPFNIQQVLANPFFRIFFKMSRNFASKTFGPPKFWRENRKNWNWTIFSAINHTFSCWI